MYNDMIDISSCDFKFKNLRGDPGSAHVVKCPSDCDKENRHISGVGFYTAESNVCTAGKHLGVKAMQDSLTDVYIVTVGYPQSKFFSKTLNNISSFE